MKKDKKGYLLEVDVEYPKKMHDKHNELLFSAERRKVRKIEKLISNLKLKKTSGH